MRAEDAIMAVWNEPLEVAERGVDDSLPEALKTVRSSVARGETPATDAFLLMFAAGVRYGVQQCRREAAERDPAAHPPTDGGAKAS